ncbi:cytochrome c maturation protein CcmE [Chiayiivirga flava]|uniref:Cytochrome c-type biogenesis protein CcmE n=1 Tax=Chiayiivirga flava TaxID=659595 RepID=A0A7W8FZP3_9GAMM|nr:cytochrome c maturation protein CcmE [Chiayiivirga flava]MBB5208326.1 cytochrome c-type biogenesis protein CcmE [Chiayiivirga flava]
MNPVRRRRLLLLVVLLLASGTAVALVAIALQQNLSYLYTPSEVLGGQARDQQRFRLGGMVKEGSLRRTEGTLDAQFVVTDGDGDMTVRYSGILPDLFREKQAVIATGALVDGQFVASEVLAKHDETYMPREVAEKMGIAHQKHNVPATEGTQQ